MASGSEASPGGSRRASSRRPGRRSKLSLPQRTVIVEEVLSGRCSAAQMARRYGVSEPTVSRIMAAYRAGAGLCQGSRHLAQDWAVVGR